MQHQGPYLGTARKVDEGQGGVQEGRFGMKSMQFRQDGVVDFFQITYKEQADQVMAEAALLDLVRRGEISRERAAAIMGIELADQAAIMAQHGLAETIPVPHPRRPIEEVLEELAAEVPDEEWEKLPADLTDQLDHYLYGTPKR